MTDLSIEGGSSRTGVLNENSSLQTATIKLDESNYWPWSQSALFRVEAFLII